MNTRPRTTYPWQRKRRKLLLLLIIPALILLAFFVYRAQLRAELNARIAELREEGVPVTRQELEAWYSTPGAGENAVDLLAVQFSSLYTPPDPELLEQELPFYVGRLEPHEPVSEDSLDAMRTLVAANESALRLLQEGTAVEHRFPLTFSARPLEEAGKLLRVRVLLAVEESESEQFLRALQAFQALHQAFLEHPLLAWQHFRLNREVEAVQLVERALNHLHLNAEQLQSLQEAFPFHDEQKTWRRALIGERATVLTHVGPYLPEDRPPGITEGLAQVLGTWDRAALGILEQFEAQMDQFDARDGRAAATGRQQQAPAGRYRRLMPMEAMRAPFQKAGASRGALHVALAVERFRLAEGRLPESLEELTPTHLPEVPLDPLAAAAGARLGYRLLEPGYAVHGADGPEDRATPEEYLRVLR